MKREFEIKKVNSILNNLIENSSLKEGLNNIKIQTIWKKTMGDNINSYTSEITLRKHTLYINLSSSVLREELSYGKEKIIKLLNEELNAEIIRKIYYITRKINEITIKIDEKTMKIDETKTKID